MGTKSVSNSLYVGRVMHKRLRPVRHMLSYTVFCVCLDCDALEETAQRLRLLSYNQLNLISIYDRDHGDGTQLKDYLTKVAADAGVGADVKRFFMLCYPRVLGYVFNPITVYFGLDDDETVRLMVYEVNNTFGGRQSYVLPVETDETDLITQSCRKQMYVSPFNTESGMYRFAVTKSAHTLTVGIALKTKLGPTMKAYFSGQREDLTDRNLLKALARTGWMTAKVTLGIHYEAMKLWLKGLPIMPRAPSPEEPLGDKSTSKESLS